MISAILLAAGESKRMGTPKQLIELDGEPMARKSLRTLLAAPIGEIIIVLGNSHTIVSEKLFGNISMVETTPYGTAAVRSVVNEQSREGMGSSIKMGIHALSPSSEAAVIALADQPFIRPDTVTALIRAFTASGKGIALPRHGERRGHPVIFGAKYYQNLCTLPPDRGANTILRDNSPDILILDVDDEGILIDIDTPEDLARYGQGH